LEKIKDEVSKMEVIDLVSKGTPPEEMKDWVNNTDDGIEPVSESKPSDKMKDEESNRNNHSFSLLRKERTRGQSILEIAQAVITLGKRDVLIAILLCVVDACCRAVYGFLNCLWCCPERTLPIDTLLIDHSNHSAIDTKLCVVDTSLCNTSSTNPNSMHESPICNTTYNAIVEGSYREITNCLGWISERRGIPSEIGFILNITIWLVLMFYCLTNLEDFNRIALLLRLTTIFIMFFSVGLPFCFLMNQDHNGIFYNGMACYFILCIVMAFIMAVFLQNYLSVYWKLSLK
jgi:hypothetical protein